MFGSVAPWAAGGHFGRASVRLEAVTPVCLNVFLNGVAQGGVSSLLLWLFYFSNIVPRLSAMRESKPEILGDAPVFDLTYADDIACALARGAHLSFLGLRVAMLSCG